MQNIKKALIASAFFIACQSALAGSCTPQGASESVSIAKVVDGDTVHLTDGRKVRLIGVNTPELFSKPRAEEGALQAKRLLQTWIQELGSLQLYFGREPKDRYGRVLGYLYDGTQTLSQRLIQEGLGWAISVPPNDRLADCLFSAEKRPRSLGKGVWSKRIAAAKDIDKGGFNLVSGRITKIDLTKKYIYLELDDRLAARLPREWSKSLTFSLGDSLEVRGWILDRRDSLKPGSGYKPFLLPVSDKRHIKL
jgi:endonuclease YncB( thermonuclease family)